MSPNILELVSQLNASIEVINDAIRSPATKDSVAIVSDLVAEMSAVRSTLQSELSASQADAPENAFAALQKAEELEPKFKSWVELMEPPREVSGGSLDFDFPDIDWDALPARTGPSQSSAPPQLGAWPLKGKVKISLDWNDIGPLLVDDPAATEETRKRRLEEFFIQSLAASCNVDAARIKAQVTSTI